MFIFGGFYDTGHDVRYFNDAYLFDFAELKWTKVGEDKKGDNMIWPSPRSACGLAEFEDNGANRSLSTPEEKKLCGAQPVDDKQRV